MRVRMTDADRFCHALRDGAATARQIADRSGLTMERVRRLANDLHTEKVITRIGSEKVTYDDNKTHGVIAVYALTSMCGCNALSEAWPMPVAPLPDGPVRVIKLGVE